MRVIDHAPVRGLKGKSLFVKKKKMAMHALNSSSSFMDASGEQAVLTTSRLAFLFSR